MGVIPLAQGPDADVDVVAAVACALVAVNGDSFHEEAFRHQEEEVVADDGTSDDEGAYEEAVEELDEEGEDGDDVDMGAWAHPSQCDEKVPWAVGVVEWEASVAADGVLEGVSQIASWLLKRQIKYVSLLSLNKALGRELHKQFGLTFRNGFQFAKKAS